MHDLPAPGTIVAGKYRVERLLGEGGMSAVFQAHHELMDKSVALKWLRPELAVRPEAKDRFIREARASARLNHPNVVDVHDVGVHEGALFLVMELLEGESFADLIGHGSIAIPSAIRLLLGAMEGVAYAHEHGIIHRDIKPENIFVVRNRVHPDGIAKILDFGISKLTDEGGAAQSLTKTGHTVGTPEYMSMEQMTGDPNVDARADVYSFGVLLYRALTGISPFTGETFAAIAVKVATESPVPPRALRPDLPPALEHVVMKAMARNREHRYASMRELIDALSFLGSTQGFLSQMPNPAGGAPLLTPTPNGLRDLLPFSNFRADTVQLKTPAQATKAITEPSIARRPAPVRKSSMAPTLIGLGLLAAAGVGAWQFWPKASVSAPSAPAAAADKAPSSQAETRSQAPLTPQPQEAQPAANTADWANPVVEVREDPIDPPPTAEPTRIPTTVPTGLPPSSAPLSGDTFQSASPHDGKPPSRRTHRERNSSHASSASPSAVTAPEPVKAPEPTPAPATKSATGRRSGTLRSDDF